jgi:hypothetical protein
MGWERADTLAEAIDMARGRQGRSASITLMHHPPMVMTDVALATEERALPATGGARSAQHPTGEGVKQLPQGGASAAKPTVAAKEEK